MVTRDLQDCCQNPFLVVMWPSSLLCVGVVVLHLLLITGCVNLSWMECVACEVYELAVPPSSCWRRATSGLQAVPAVRQELLDFVTSMDKTVQSKVIVGLFL